MTTYNMESGKWVCECCGEYTEEDKRKVNMHEVRCKMKAAGEEPAPLNFDPIDEEREREKPPRRERVPFGVPQSRLPQAKDDGFYYRVFNDGWMKEPGRVQRAVRAGYEVVNDCDPITVGTNENGTPIKGILMRIPKEWHEEDEKLKQKEIDKVDSAIRKGKLEEKAGDNRYIPQGIKIYSSTNENG